MIASLGRIQKVIGVAFLLFLGSYSLYAQDNLKFTNLSVNDGLSQSTIFSIYQDSKGFIWLGTRGGGLNKYNGYDFQVYVNKQDEAGSLSDNTVLAILEDTDGVLWVGTQKGMINRFDPNSGRFKTYKLHLSTDVNQDQSMSVRCLYEDREGTLWVGTNQRVYRYDQQVDSFYPALNDAPFPVKGTTSICEDREGYFYFATWDRLIRYHPEQDSYDQLTYPTNPFASFGGRINPLMLDSKNRLWLGSQGGLRMVDINKGFYFTKEELDRVDWPVPFNYVRVIKEAKDGMLWFGTENGLYAYSPDEYKLVEYSTEPNNSQSLGHNSVYSIYEDRVGTIWIGTWSGLSILDKRKYNFEHYKHLFNDPRSLSDNVVSSFQEDTSGIWVGTEQGGLNFFRYDSKEFHAFKHAADDPKSLLKNNVKTVYKDSRDNLWVGTFNGGLSLYLGNGKFEHFLEGHSVYSITEMSDGKLYIGGRTGLHAMDIDTKSISREVFLPSSGVTHFESFVSGLVTDSQNRLWIGTRDLGLLLYDPQRSLLKHFYTSQTDSTSISSDYIISICEDKEKNIWIGTYSGLNKFHEENYSFERVNHKISLTDNVINGLQVDDEGKIWILTYNGIYSYNETTDELRHFDYLDGLQSNEFNRRAAYKSKSGELYLGGVNGFNVFHPADIKKNMDAPPVIITDLKLFNKSVVPGQKNSPLKKHISDTRRIVLTHKQSSFSFEFVALNYLVPEKNAYSYILEGYEDEWNDAGRMRTASYMNLKPGEYTFRLKGSNNDGIWNEDGASIDVKVLAPFWATPLAIMMYVVLMFGLLFALIRIVKFRAEKENELRLERAEKSRIKELNINRLQYFTNISHEFRTPLTLIAGPLDKLISGKYTHQSEYLLQLMKSNVNRMLRLVNQLMDFRKLENNKMPLRIQRKNIDKFLSQIVLGFEDMASNKMIEIRYVSDSELSDKSYQWFDVGILDKVIYNLLSNAFKFTSEHGIIQVRLKIEEETAIIEVSDTGKGIDQEKVKRIFERYYSDSADFYTGTGIGLALSKRLIDLHKGTIDVESEKGKGAIFSVILPISRDAFQPEEIFTEEDLVLDRPALNPIETLLPHDDASIDSEKKKQLVLVVEDNPEMLSYLANLLNDYMVIKAENGKIAFELAKEQIPDIIISDVMMPEMNGIEFCRVLKKEYLTSHVPVILLTAKTAVDEKIEGIEKAGADAYMEKPFDADYLLAMVRNLLVQRKNLKEKFSGLSGDEINDETTNENEEFLHKINEIVLNNISDLSFSVDQLLVEVGMSRSQLYRKFKAISHKNPSEYIRILRLQHACKMLKNESHTISEISIMSGFGNVSYFNTCFKRHFGVSPGKYLKEKIRE